MKPSTSSYAMTGAALALLVSVGYVFFGPMDFLGFPEPRWAAMIFYPGSYVGMLTYEHVTRSMPLCYAAGVVTMTFVGAVLGLLMDLIVGLGRRS